MKTQCGEWQSFPNANLDEYSMDIINIEELIYYLCMVYNSAL